MNPNPKICIIGAGPCGITIAKNLLEQGLNNFIVFEKNNQIGGNWVFDEQNNHSSVYETTHIISSKKLSEFEDFPMPEDYPDYPSHRQLLTYFNNYADNFGVKPFIRFNTTVEEVVISPSKQWQITFSDSTGQQQLIFDYLFIANGHHWDPIIPDYPGNFTGTLLHAHSYKKADLFKKQEVLVVGLGNSACDIAVEVSRVAAKTCISNRKGQHIFPKFIFGKPTDIALKKISWLPLWIRQFLANLIIRVIQGRYAKYNLPKPQIKPLAAHPTVNSELLYFIRHGKINPRPAIKSFDGDYVEFTDGTKEKFDVIIFATGYKTSFPFFKDNLLEYDPNQPLPLYKKMLHSKFDNLFFIGLFQPIGCIWPLADYQAKIAAKIICGQLKPPHNLNNKIQNEIQKTKKRFQPSPRHFLEVDYHAFRKELLAELNVATLASK